jgi:hypothetical protein
MKARGLFPLLAAMALALAVAGPAAAKGAITEANINGPGLGGGSGSLRGGGGMRIDAPATDRMWESGIMDDTKKDAVSEFGLTPTDLGPKYLVTYRFDFGAGTLDDLIQQELYPYAKGGPVTYTPPGQHFSSEEFDAPLSSGWWQSEPGFLQFLVENGLPATNPVAGAASADQPGQEPADQPVPVTRSAPWAWILVGLGGLAVILSLAAPRVRRRVLAVARVNH